MATRKYLAWNKGIKISLTPDWDLTTSCDLYGPPHSLRPNVAMSFIPSFFSRSKVATRNEWMDRDLEMRTKWQKTKQWTKDLIADICLSTSEIGSHPRIAIVVKYSTYNDNFIPLFWKLAGFRVPIVSLFLLKGDSWKRDNRVGLIVSITRPCSETL